MKLAPHWAQKFYNFLLVDTLLCFVGGKREKKRVVFCFALEGSSFI
ncbi:hypothetical protein PLUTE_b0553 [Pseudoalteromonas luteoviolacea DSM 6061]|nr:hypothetical protein [Pseudoalteromonas luteoviolacea DSM 6061]